MWGLQLGAKGLRSMAHLFVRCAPTQGERTIPLAMARVNFKVDYDEPLTGDILLAEAVQAPPADRLKGMFFGEQVKIIGREAFDLLEPQLASPPRFGRYLPFVDYPMRDFQLLLWAAAQKRFPQGSRREAYRRLGRAGIESFRLSTVGRVVVAVVSDPMSGVKKLDDVLAMVASPTRVKVEAKGPSHAVVVYSPYHGIAPYDFGVLEGTIRYFGGIPSAEVTVESEVMTIDVSWRADRQV